MIQGGSRAVVLLNKLLPALVQTSGLPNVSPQNQSLSDPFIAADLALAQ
jgi:hypothetical protein